METITIIQGDIVVTKEFVDRTELRHWIINHLDLSKPITILELPKEGQSNE